jgi:phosphate transport system substrate-binding protein
MKSSMNTVLSAVTLAALMVSLGFAGPAAMGQERRVVIDGSTTVEPIAKAFAGYHMAKNPEVDITVSGTGSGNGAQSLINGRCHVAIMSRFMKGKEFKAAVENGVYPVFHTVAMDGIAVVVHPSNPVSKLTTDQIRKIYNGTVTNWNEVGGPNKRIVVISRDTTSGTYEVFGDLVLKGDRIRNAEYVGSNPAARARVSKTAGAIGYVGLGFLEGVKALEVNGVRPNLKTVGGGAYPVARPLFMVTDGYPELGTPTQAIVTMHLKPHGQEIVKGIGLVPVTQY